AGAIAALRSFNRPLSKVNFYPIKSRMKSQFCKRSNASESAQKQIERIISQLGRFNLRDIFTLFSANFDVSAISESVAASARSALSARLFEGYVQGFCETKQFVKSLPCRVKPVIVWIYANPSLEDSGDAPALAHKELSLIADLSDLDFNCLRDRGKFPYADLLFIVRTYHNDAYRFHLVCYELSTHNTPNISDALNLSDPNDVYESLRLGKSAASRTLKTRDFRIASDTLGLEISPELKDYFRGLLTHDKIAKKLFQAGGYLFSLYDTLRDRIIPQKPFDNWLGGQGNIEFHIVAFTDRARHFLHVRENEIGLLEEMGIVYKGVKGVRPQTLAEERRFRDREILKTQEAVLRNIRKNVSPKLLESLKELEERMRQTFSGQKPLPDYLHYAFSETIQNYCPTAAAPSSEQLEAWLGTELAGHLTPPAPSPKERGSLSPPLRAGGEVSNSMQDAHAEIVKYVWHQHDSDILVLSGTPGIGKTTTLRHILADYDCGYLLVYISPRLQVNTDLLGKFDPCDASNRLAGKEELICLTTNHSLIKASENLHKMPALSCRSLNLPDDSKLLFLSPQDAEELERSNAFVRKRAGYRLLEKGGVGESGTYMHEGVIKTVMQAVYRLNLQHRYKRIVACMTTQANLQLANRETTLSRHLKRIFGPSRETDIADVEKFATNIKEIIFFIDEVTGDRAGRQTAQEIIAFVKELKKRFDEIGKSCPLKIRILIADASLINASSVETYLNRTKSHPDQILFCGNADQKGLSLESAKIMGLPAKIVNANVYPASKLTLKWRAVLDFCAEASGKRGDDPVRKAYRKLENRILESLAVELLQGWREKPEEQVIVIIQNKESVDSLKNYIRAYWKASDPSGKGLHGPEVICLDAHTPSWQKRDIVTPASDEEKKRKKRIAGIWQKGDLADIIIMTSSGTRGISFPNAGRIICMIPTFSMENNFMEFLQGMYRGRGSGKGNLLEREIEVIIPQVLVSPGAGEGEISEAAEAAQIANLFATYKIMRMSIFTRIFGGCDLFGKSVSCIPISGSLVRGAVQTTMDSADGAIRSLERASKRDPANTDLRYIAENVRDIFKDEKVILSHSLGRSGMLASDDYRKRLLSQFIQDANAGLDRLAVGNYIPEECYTVGQIILQNLDSLNVREKNKHLIETHLEDVSRKIRAICAKLDALVKDDDTVKTVRDPANALLAVLSMLSEETESDTESLTKGSTLNRWLVMPLSALNIREFWKHQPEPERFKAEMKEMLEDYFSAYLCRPHCVLPLHSAYNDTVPPWLLVRGPEIAQMLDAQFQTRYLVCSSSLALLNMMLLGRNAAKTESRHEEKI
ncbi:MAG: hypothetical protein BWK80_18310, partial [Desulfobacteraceae bacterium IS3]